MARLLGLLDHAHHVLVTAWDSGAAHRMFQRSLGRLSGLGMQELDRIDERLLLCVQYGGQAGRVSV